MGCGVAERHIAMAQPTEKIFARTSEFVKEKRFPRFETPFRFRQMTMTLRSLLILVTEMS